MLEVLSEHLNHIVNSLAAMLNTAIRDFKMDKSGVYNEAVNYVTRMRDASDFIEFTPPMLNRASAQLIKPLELQILYDPFKPREAQYEINHETMLAKPNTSSEVLEILLTDIVHVTNGLIYMINKVERDFMQNRFDLYNSVIHQLILIRGFGLDLSKENPTFAEKRK